MSLPSHACSLSAASFADSAAELVAELIADTAAELAAELSADSTDPIPALLSAPFSPSATFDCCASPRFSAHEVHCYAHPGMGPGCSFNRHGQCVLGYRYFCPGCGYGVAGMFSRCGSAACSLSLESVAFSPSMPPFCEPRPVAPAAHAAHVARVAPAAPNLDVYNFNSV